MDEVTVDRKTLKALGADTRIAILKHLAKRRMTQTELAEVLGIAVPSANEHLHSLQSAQLVSLVNEGHKWKYFEITPKGRAIVEPTNVKVWFLLGISLLALAASFSQLYGVFSAQVPQELIIREITSTQPESTSQAAASSVAPEALIQTTSISSTDNQEAQAQDNNIQPPEQQVEPRISERREVISYDSLISRIPVAETAVFLASFLFLGAAVALLLKKE